MFRNPVINVNSHTLGSLPLKNDNFNGLVDGEIAVNNNENDPFLSIKKYNTEGLKSDDFAKFIPEDKIDKKIETFENLQLITYSELVTLRNNSQLIPGRKYRIIDYSTTTSETDTVSAGHDFDIVVSAVSNSQLSEMADAIAFDMKRGVTVLPAKGWYSKEDKQVLMVVTRKNDLNLLLRYVKSIDPDAFLSVSTVMGVYGKGFDTIKVKSKKQNVSKSTDK